MKAVLGIDTSCYTTSCAVVDEELSLLASHRMLLPVKKGNRGLRQSEAVFIHLKQLPLVLQMTRDQTKTDLSAICVSAKPTDSKESYMPVFQAGLTVAASLAVTLGIPCFETNHQSGHLSAALYQGPSVPQCCLAMHLSGGTTDLLLVHQDQLHSLGTSLDLHAGQLIDRIGVRMGLPFPSGPALEKLAQLGAATGRYGVNISGLNVHLSGAEAQAMRDISLGLLSQENIAAEVFDFLARSVYRLLFAAQEKTGYNEAVIFGGVASSILFRGMLTQRMNARLRKMNLIFGLPEYSGDNAVGVALIGAKRILAENRRN